MACDWLGGSSGKCEGEFVTEGPDRFRSSGREFEGDTWLRIDGACVGPAAHKERRNHKKRKRHIDFVPLVLLVVPSPSFFIQGVHSKTIARYPRRASQNSVHSSGGHRRRNRGRHLRIRYRCTLSWLPGSRP